MLLLAGFVICGMGRAQSVPASTVEQALSRFLVAFNNLDWPAFRVCFAQDATMFHPASPNIKRIDSPEAFEKAWLGVFARIKKQSGRDKPPYMNLRPQDLLIQMLRQTSRSRPFA
jgi:hypothetical protein